MQRPRLQSWIYIHTRRSMPALACPSPISCGCFTKHHLSQFSLDDDDVGLHVLGCRMWVMMMWGFMSSDVGDDDVGLHVLGCRRWVMMMWGFMSSDVGEDDVGLRVH